MIRCVSSPPVGYVSIEDKSNPRGLSRENLCEHWAKVDATASRCLAASNTLSNSSLGWKPHRPVRRGDLPVRQRASLPKRALSHRLAKANDCRGYRQHDFLGPVEK